MAVGVGRGAREGLAVLGMEAEGWESFVSAISAYFSAHPVNNLAKTLILLFFKRRRSTKHDFSTHLYYYPTGRQALIGPHYFAQQ